MASGRYDPAATPLSLAVEAEQWWRATAALKMGVNDPETLITWFHNFGIRGTNGVFSKVNGTSSITGGDRSVLVSSGAGAGTQELYPGSAGTAADPAGSMPAGTGVKWMVGGYFKINTTIDATATVGVGAVNPNGGTAQLNIGARGSVSTTNFSLWGLAGTPTDSGQALDTNYHRFLAWRDGTSGWFQIDNGAIIASSARPNVDGCAYAQAQETGAAAGARTMNIVWMANAYVRP